MSIINKELNEFHFEPKSDFIKSISYSYTIVKDKKVSELITIFFCDGSVVEYKPLLEFGNEGKLGTDLSEVFIKMKECQSVGKFWHRHIKGVLDYKKIR